MGRRNAFDLSNYVIYDPITNKSRCLHPDCGRLLAGKRNANIRRHYMLMHSATFAGEDYAVGDESAIHPEDFLKHQFAEESQSASTKNMPIKVEIDAQIQQQQQLQASLFNSARPVTIKSIPQRPSETYTLLTVPQRNHLSPSTEQGALHVSEPYSTVEMAKLDEKIGFIGGGNMAIAIGSGLISRGIVKPGQVCASGPNLEKLIRWRDLGAEITEDNYEVLDKSDIIFICVKPHILTPCATHLRSVHEPTTKDKEKLFVSVLAGVNLKSLEESFNFIVGLKMIRTMPNTPMQVGEGCTVYTAGTYVKQQDLEKVHLMLNSLGIAQQVPESMIDAVTGVTGCGPAYVYTFIEALADGAVKCGVPRQMALQFAAQTVLGPAKTVLATGRHPAVLRDEVCSPGGSTIVGVHELEKGNFRATVMNAVEASSKRSAELGKK